jgi:hypothetical protein
MRNWKTTLLGLLAAVIIALQPLLDQGEVTWKSLLLAAAIAALGYFAKDKDVSGVS